MINLILQNTFIKSVEYVITTYLIYSVFSSICLSIAETIATVLIIVHTVLLCGERWSRGSVPD